MQLEKAEGRQTRLTGFLPRVTLRRGTVGSRGGGRQEALGSSNNAKVIYWRMLTGSVGSHQTANIFMSSAWDGEDCESKLVVMTEFGDLAYFIPLLFVFGSSPFFLRLSAHGLSWFTRIVENSAVLWVDVPGLAYLSSFSALSRPQAWPGRWRL